MAEFDNYQFGNGNKESGHSSSGASDQGLNQVKCKMLSLSRGRLLKEGNSVAKVVKRDAVF